MHFNAEIPAMRLVKMSHNRDPGRGNAAYGYTVYIARDGTLFQAAPLSRRTNHVKPPGHRKRRANAPREASNSTAIGISAVGACRQKPNSAAWTCKDRPTPEQIAAGIDAVKAIQNRFDLPCRAVWGHGELQTDRIKSEGTTIAKAVRDACEDQKPGIRN